MSYWYYFDTTRNQKGPELVEVLQKEWAAGTFDDTCYCWNESMAGWKPLLEVTLLRDQLVNTGRAKAPAKAPPAFQPPTQAAHAPQTRESTDSKSTVALSSSSSSPSSSSSAASSLSVAVSASSSLRAGSRKSVVYSPKASYASSGTAGSSWKEMTTPQGQVYYYNKALNKTQWEKPDELKTDADLEKQGQWFWVSDAEEGFVPGKRVGSENGGKEVVFEREHGARMSRPASESKTFERMYWSQLNNLQDDLVMLDVMNEPLVLYSLKKRFEKNEIYTNVGTILISCNPYKRLPLYTPTVLDQYINRGNQRLKPHVFEIADRAYKNLREFRKSQSVVISGESGAGKTECTKQVLQFLAEVAGSSSSSSVNVEQRILDANPILEAYGNAKTLRNNNSSRFGKYVEIFFDNRGTISGARNTNYLLEKTRVVTQMEGERNYHIFYQMIRGAGAALKKRLRLKDVNDYHYLNQSGCTVVSHVDDMDEYEDVVSAMEALDFKQAEVASLWDILAGILHMGNIEFESVGDRKCRISSASRQSTEDAAALLQVDAKDFERVVTHRVMRMRGAYADPVSVPLAAKEAAASRDALAKFIYAANFDWLIKRVNQSIGKGTRAVHSIGILDIFGFEIFEQICINFANEKLQQFFNAHTFKKEEALYRSEGITFTHVKYIDNQPVLDLIEKKPYGLLPSIDEELRIPNGCVSSWLDKVFDRHKGTPEFAEVRSNKQLFQIKHYAGEVVYESNGFLAKNKDRLVDDAFLLLSKSKFGFLAQMFPASALDNVAGKASGRNVTLGAKFRGQLSTLMTTLNATEPHYIRCIKPNPNKAPLEFVGEMSLKQLRYAGVFEAVKIRKQGYPFRLTHMEFFRRYKCVYPQDHPWAPRVLDNIQHIIKDMQLDTTQIQIGSSRVLYRAPQYRAMELKRNLALESVSVFLQTFVRRRAAQLLEEKIRELAPVLRAAVASRDIDQVNAALVKGEEIGFETYEMSQIRRIKYVFEEEKRLKGVMEVLLTQDPYEYFQQFDDFVVNADDIGMDSELSNRIRTLHAKAKATRDAIAADAEAQLSVLKEDEMKAIIDRADGISLVQETVEHLRKLLFDTSEDAFVKLQLKAAVGLKDQERIINKTIRLKELFFEKAGAMFEFKNFPGLLSPAAWAGKKFLCFDREALAASKLVWSKQPIHAPLSRIRNKDKVATKAVIRLYKNVLAYMGDRKYEFPVILAQELLQQALDSKLVRDEIYCQIIKQISENPSPKSHRRGLDLLFMCLKTFPPNSELENYLEIYLRTQLDKERSAKFVQVFHATLYGGQRASIPNEHEMFEWTDGGAGKRRGYSQCQDSAAAGDDIKTDPHHHTQASPASSQQQRLFASSSSSDQKSAPAPPAPLSRPGPPAPPPPQPFPEPEIDQSITWYWLGAPDNNQCGPGNAAQLKEAYVAGSTTAECLVWNPSLDGWKVIKALEDLHAYLKY